MKLWRLYVRGAPEYGLAVHRDSFLLGLLLGIVIGIVL